MYKICVIGDKNSVQGFLAIGLDIFTAYDRQDAVDTIKKCVRDDYAIIYITEKLFMLAEDEIDKYKDSKIPAIIPIPAAGENLGIGLKNVTKSVERAVGSDILSNE